MSKSQGRTSFDALPSVAVLNSLQEYIQNSEYTLILFMQSKGKWQGSLPSPPPNYVPGSGTVELGLVAYWLNNVWVLNKLSFSTKLAISAFLTVWSVGSPTTFPVSKMTTANADYLNTNKGDLVYPDGSVLSGQDFATYDQLWFLAMINLLLTFFKRAWRFPNGYPALTATPIPARGNLPNFLRVGILGDWGTGDATAKNVMASLIRQNPDYIVHVGDVYYSGTPDISSSYGKTYYNPNEELNNLVNIWPPAFNGKSFTLNSNHEMYTGGNGYFGDALTLNGPFSAHKGEGVFALRFYDWTIIGLDSAYEGTSFDAFMQGNIGSATGSQSNWLKGLRLQSNKTIVMTHHNAIADDGSAINALWTQVTTALGGEPFAWYWGHVHNGIAYTQPMTIPVSSHSVEAVSSYLRCVGHSAIPYGIATALQNNPNVEWYAENMQPGTELLYNGYATLEFQVTGNTVSGITEHFFDLSSASAVFSKKIL